MCAVELQLHRFGFQSMVISNGVGAEKTYMHTHTRTHAHTSLSPRASRVGRGLESNKTETQCIADEHTGTWIRTYTIHLPYSSSTLKEHRTTICPLLTAADWSHPLVRVVHGTSTA